MAEDLAFLMGFGFGSRTVRYHAFEPETEPRQSGATSWKFAQNDCGRWDAEIYFETPEHASAALDRLREDGYDIIEE